MTTLNPHRLWSGSDVFVLCYSPMTLRPAMQKYIQGKEFSAQTCSPLLHTHTHTVAMTHTAGVELNHVC